MLTDITELLISKEKADPDYINETTERGMNRKELQHTQQSQLEDIWHEESFLGTVLHSTKQSGRMQD